MVIHYENSNIGTLREPAEDLYLPNKICEIVFDQPFGHKFHNLLSYCGALDRMQADKACLFEVILSFGYFIKFWEEYDDRSLAEGMIT